MNTTAAAQQAGVTTATVRTWCRAGAVAATKTGRRWDVSAASLARRIALGIRHPRKAGMDLNATHTAHYASGPRTVAVKVKTFNGVTSINGLAPLLADDIAAIADEGDRIHAMEVLLGANIAIRPAGTTIRRHPMITADGRISTTYAGAPGLPVERVIELGHQLAAHLGK